MQKPTTLTPLQRKAQLTALMASGLSQRKAAQALGVDRSTIKRDLEEIRPTVEAVQDLQKRAEDYIEQIMPIERRIDEQIAMLQVAKVTKQPAAGSAILSRLDDMQGFVTLKELTRAKQSEQPANQAMFILAPGMNISFGPSTTGSESKSLHNTSTVPGTPVIDVPIYKDADSREISKGGTVNKDEEH